MTNSAIAKSYLKSTALRLGCLLISDERFSRWQYKRATGRSLDLTTPVTFNEKIQWLKLNCRDDIYRRCADKYEVREYVRRTIGDDVLTELYGVYTSAGQVDFATLPYPCVLKVTHGSGQNVFLRHKDSLEPKHTRLLLTYYLRTSHYIVGREWAYKQIVPRIICEEMLSEQGSLPKDYRVFCFNGEPRVILVQFEYFRGHDRNLAERKVYDTEWNLLPWVAGGYGVSDGYEDTEENLERPTELSTMLEYSRQLARGFPFVRVDWYYIDDEIVFGEMTFYPWKGVAEFRPGSYDRVLGSYLELADNATVAGRS